MSLLNTLESAINLIEQGVELEEWKLVHAGLFLLQSEDRPAKQLPQSSKLKKSPKPQTETQQQSRDSLDFTVNKKKKGRSERVVGKNKFEDMVNNIKIEEDPAEYEAINDNIKPTPRKRPKYKDIKVTCIECDEMKNVNPALVLDKNSFTCSGCLEKRVRGKR